jgi:hypothetical protein
LKLLKMDMNILNVGTLDGTKSKTWTLVRI